MPLQHAEQRYWEMINHSSVFCLAWKAPPLRLLLAPSDRPGSAGRASPLWGASPVRDRNAPPESSASCFLCSSHRWICGASFQLKRGNLVQRRLRSRRGKPDLLRVFVQPPDQLRHPDAGGALKGRTVKLLWFSVFMVHMGLHWSTGGALINPTKSYHKVKTNEI